MKEAKTQKQFLDDLYGVRQGIISNITKYSDQINSPIPKCCDNMHYVNAEKIKLDEAKTYLAVTDALIESFLQTIILV